MTQNGRCLHKNQETYEAEGWVRCLDCGAVKRIERWSRWIPVANEQQARAWIESDLRWEAATKARRRTGA